MHFLYYLIDISISPSPTDGSLIYLMEQAEITILNARDKPDRTVIRDPRSRLALVPNAATWGVRQREGKTRSSNELFYTQAG